MKLSDAQKVRIAGMKMSNWLYNMRQTSFNSQTQSFNPPDQAEAMKEMVDEWDAVVNLLPRSKKGFWR